MGAKDIKAKEYLSDNTRFADLCNYYLFEGKNMIRPENLVAQDTTELLSVFGTTKKELQVQKWRDILKQAVIKKTDSCVYAIIGVENQTDIHYAMPVRCMIYDALNYGKQVNEAAKKHKKKKDFVRSEEFLSGFTSQDKLTPVITITLYWGADQWKAPRSIYDMFPDMEENILQYVSDYKLNLIIPSEITDFEKFKTSLGAVLEVIKLSKDETAMGKLITTNPAFKNLEMEAVRTINLFAKLDIGVDMKEDTSMDMCKAWADHKEAGRREGINEGELIKLVELVMKKLKKGNTQEEIADMLEEKPETVRTICECVEQAGSESNVTEIYRIFSEKQ